MKNQGIRTLIFTKQVIYSLMIIAFVFLTSCIVKNSLLTFISPPPVTEKFNTKGTYNAPSSPEKCAISESATREVEMESLKLLLSLAIFGVVAKFFVKLLGYQHIQNVCSPFKVSGLSLIWLFTCVFRL